MKDNWVKKGLVVSIILLFVGVGIIPSIAQDIEKPLPTSKGNWLYVGGSGPGNYTRIQDAINNSSSGDVVFVYDESSPYYENVIIDRPIYLLAEKTNTTTIDGRKKGDTIHVISSKVHISGFYITNSSRNSWFAAGVRLTASNVSLDNNTFQNNKLGIFGKRVLNITISHNDFTGDGIIFSMYDNETETIPFSEQYFHHTVYDNQVNGKRLYFYQNKQDFTVPLDAGQIIAVGCSNMIVRNVNLSNADFGCILVNCSFCVVQDIELSHSDGMMWLIASSSNIIARNKFEGNFEGLCIDMGSIGNIISDNTISKNGELGIILEEGSNDNTLYNNNFINQSYPAYFRQSYSNTWRQNYWNRPKILPKIIFGTTVAMIPWMNFDWHPLLKPHNINPRFTFFFLVDSHKNH
jgi:parallel beta-helix repeat protein